MTISLWQGIVIGLWTGFCLSGQLLGIYTNRSLVLALGVGVILGDVPTALAMGAVSEIAFMGFWCWSRWNSTTKSIRTWNHWNINGYNS